MKAIAKTRDTRLDVLRALALLMIFVDHVPGQPLEFWTLRNFGFSDASEIFVLISGIAVALAYGGKYQPGNLMMLGRKAWHRAATLFAAHLAGTFVTLGIFIAFAWGFMRSDLLTQISIGPVVEAPLAGIIALVTLGHQLGFNNILPMYMVLMLMVPAIIWLESRSPTLLLVVSVAIWAVAGTFRIGPPNMLEPGIWFFNPLSWQLMFVIGYTGMRHVKRGHQIGGDPLLFTVSLAFVLFSAVWTLEKFGGNSLSLGLPYVLTGFDKTYLTGWRILHVMSLTYVFISIPALSRLTRLGFNNPLSVIGRHGLSIFMAGTILSVLAQAILLVTGNNPQIGLILVSAGFVIQIGVAYFLEYRNHAHAAAKPRVRATASQPLHVGTLGKPA